MSAAFEKPTTTRAHQPSGARGALDLQRHEEAKTLLLQNAVARGPTRLRSRRRHHTRGDEVAITPSSAAAKDAARRLADALRPKAADGRKRSIEPGLARSTISARPRRRSTVGSAHPIEVIERDLKTARATLRARETAPSPAGRSSPSTHTTRRRPLAAEPSILNIHKRARTGDSPRGPPSSCSRPRRGDASSARSRAASRRTASATSYGATCRRQ